MKRRQRVVKTLSYLFLSVSSFIMIYPTLFMVLGAFTTDERFLETTFLPVPNTLNLSLFRSVWNSGVAEAYVFTLFRCGFYITLSLITGLIGGYIFSKMRFPGKNQVFLLFLSGLVMPAILMTVPMFLMAARFPLMGGNDLWGQGGHGLIWEWPVLFVYGWVPPFAIFFLKQSFDMLPLEYQEAAKMDGAGIFTIIFRVYGPLLKAPLATLIIIVFLTMWNDYLWPSLTISTYSDYLPITMRIQNVATTRYPAAMIQTLLALWPPAAVYFLLQRYLVQGLISSGLKG